jgi:hypothetical protein
MPSTDPSLIAVGLSNMIAGATVATYGSKNNAFVHASKKRSWPLRGDEDIDREFTIDHVKMLEPLDFGMSTISLYRGEAAITIGHTKMGDEMVARGRRDADLMILARVLMAEAGRPSGVATIVKTGESTVELERFWLTTQTYEILYTGTAI